MAALKIITAAFTEKDEYTLAEISAFLFPQGDRGDRLCVCPSATNPRATGVILAR